MAPTLHLVYSTSWIPKDKDGKAISPEVVKKLPAAFRKAVQKLLAEKPLCCELCDSKFLALLDKAARKSGMDIVRWPISSREDWLSFGKVAGESMAPGAAAVLLHAWHGGYEKECVPAWDYYPVLEAVAAKHVLLYPSAALDRLHSEKRYTSELMPPTQFLHMVRGSGGDWRAAEGSRLRDVAEATAAALARLRAEAAAAGLDTKDVMLKQGLSWGGKDVLRLAPAQVLPHLQKKLLAKVPPEAASLTVLLQAKVDLVAELRWVVFEGRLRGCGWRTFEQAPRGAAIVKAGMKGEQESREALARAGLALEEGQLRHMEQEQRVKVEQVLEEAVRDAAGEVPQFLRVDLLVDRQGRAWLGERESWGADLIGGTYSQRTGAFTRHDPSRAEVASAMIARACQLLGAKPVAKAKRSLPNVQRRQRCNGKKPAAARQRTLEVRKRPAAAKQGSKRRRGA